MQIILIIENSFGYKKKILGAEMETDIIKILVELNLKNLYLFQMKQF